MGDTIVSQVLLDDKILHPLQFFAGGLSSAEGSVHPLAPILEDGSRRVYFPTHRTIIIHSGDENNDKTTPIVNEFDQSLVQHVYDVPKEKISSVPPNSGDVPVRVCTELADDAHQRMLKGDRDRATIDQLWKDSRVVDLRNILLKTVERQPTQGDTIPNHVRDLIAAILTTKLPSKLPSLSDLRDLTARDGELVGELNGMMADGKKELWHQSVMSPRPISRNPITAPSEFNVRMSQVQFNLLSRTEQRFKMLHAKMKAKVSELMPSTAPPDKTFILLNSAYILSDLPPLDQQQQQHQESSPSIDDPRILLAVRRPSFGLLREIFRSGLRHAMFSTVDGIYSRQIDTKQLRRAPDNSVPNVFGEMRHRMQVLEKPIENYVRRARNNFVKTSTAGVLGSAMIATFGADIYLGLACLVLTFVIAQRRFNADKLKAWVMFEFNKETMAEAALDEAYRYLMSYAKGENGNKPTDVKLYRQKEEELEEAKKELAEARALLLEMAPSLRRRFEKWGDGPIKSDLQGALTESAKKVLNKK
ncbi:hypothetical protein AA313_de0204542 [Arthrobotrys entomopaga]|nr:hypothetical protein AA313_de0204542 [Arthrobotrys entomopaga]